MKTIKILCILTFLFLLSTPAYAMQDGASSSYANTADGVGYAHQCYLTKIKGKTDGTNNLTLKVYDNASAASGNVIAEFTILGPDIMGGEVFDHLIISNGLFVDMTTEGTGTWWVEFKKP